MIRSDTMPRHRGVRDSPPPPPPHRAGGGTLTRSVSTLASARSHNSVDVMRLRTEIDRLTRQLSLVKAQLDSKIEETTSQQPDSFNDTIDSRLSTAMFSSSSSIHHTPTPQPTRMQPLVTLIESTDSSNASTLRMMPTSVSNPDLVRTAPDKISRSDGRLLVSACIPSTSIVMPRIRRREAFRHDEVSTLGSRPVARVERVKRADSLNIGNSLPPPKPVRTFAETFTHARARPVNVICHNPQQNSGTGFGSTSIAPLPVCSHESTIKLMKERFDTGKCWFTQRNHLMFVNPYNDISGKTSMIYPAVSDVSMSLIRSKSAALILRGIAGSGKSQIAEMITLQLADRLHCRNIHALKAVLTVLRPFLSINNRHNNQASKAVQHFEFTVKDSYLTRINLKHFFVDCPSRGCRANIFAMMANDMNEKEQDQYKIIGFQLREKYSNYGKLDDVKLALTTLGFHVADIFKVLSACTLMNNLIFKEMKGFVDVENLPDLEDASALLGISALSLYRTLLSCTVSGLNSIAECQNVRDDLVTALYSRMVLAIVDAANHFLDHTSDIDEESFDDSGIGMSPNLDSRIIHVIDVPGFIRATNNSLSELLINTINDQLLGIGNDMATDLLQKIELSHKSNDRTLGKKSVMTLCHCNGKFDIEYDLRRIYHRNKNTVSRDLVQLFDVRSCSSHFIAKLFAADVEKTHSDANYEPRSAYPDTDATVIQNVLENTKSLQRIIANSFSQEILCLKSNDRLEYSRFQEKIVSEQLLLYERNLASERKDVEVHPQKPPSRPIDLDSRQSDKLTIDVALAPSRIVPVLPSARKYEIRDGRKHQFPQRRSIVVDFHDPSTGISLYAGQVVRAIGFFGECYLIESGGGRAAVPISFTEKSLPPSDGFSV